MTWLVAMERNGKIRDALRRRGIEAISCDLRPTTVPGPHIEGDVVPLLKYRWSGVIAHPDCTYLTHAGIRWLYHGGRKENGVDEDRWAKMEAACETFLACLKANAPFVAVENPKMHPHALQRIGRAPSQIVQPWWFGDPFFKGTCWWIEGLPLLQPTDMLTPPAYGTDSYKAWSAVHRMPKSADRADKRAETYPGMAEAIGDQWGLGDLLRRAA